MAVVVGLAAAAQQYASNYFYTGSGFNIPYGSSEVVILSMDGATVLGTINLGPNLIGMAAAAYANAPDRPKYQFDEKSKVLEPAINMADSAVTFNRDLGRPTIDIRFDNARIEQMRKAGKGEVLATVIEVDQATTHFAVLVHTDLLTMTDAVNIRAWILGHELIHVDQKIRMGGVIDDAAWLRNEIEAHTWQKTNAGRFSIPKAWARGYQQVLDTYIAKCKVTPRCMK